MWRASLWHISYWEFNDVCRFSACQKEMVCESFLSYMNAIAIRLLDFSPPFKAATYQPRLSVRTRPANRICELVGWAGGKPLAAQLSPSVQRGSSYSQWQHGTCFGTLSNFLVNLRSPRASSFKQQMNSGRPALWDDGPHINNLSWNRGNILIYISCSPQTKTGVIPLYIKY